MPIVYVPSLAAPTFSVVLLLHGRRCDEDRSVRRSRGLRLLVSTVQAARAWVGNRGLCEVLPQCTVFVPLVMRRPLHLLPLRAVICHGSFVN